MRITEITNNNNQKVSKVQGNKVTIDQGDGTELTVDTTKNKNVIGKDSDGSVTVNPSAGNSSMGAKKPKDKIRPGQRVKTIS
jgi:sporulation protein YlmC with PRC-barrel domain